MKTIHTVAILAAFTAGAAIAACGGSGSASTAGNAGSGHGGSGSSAGHGAAATGSSSKAASTGTGGMSTGSGFDAGTLGDGGSMRDGDACGSVALMSQLTPGNIVVVFDQSNSMKQPYQDADGGAGDGGAGDGGAADPKYQVAEDALIAGLTPDKGILNVGAIFFPTIDTGNTCSMVDPIGNPPQIPIEPGKAFLKDFKAHFSASGWSLILGTPTALALQNADAALPDPSPFPGQRAVVILTDGAPTCDKTQADILAPVQDMFSRGIKTYAVGLPGSANAASLLDAIAQAGGTGSYLSPGDPAALQAALAQIATSTIDQCTITLSPPPPNSEEVYLIVTDTAHPDGYVVPRGDGGGDGWTLSSDGTTATLTGAVCTTAKDGGYTSVQFVYGCPTLPT